MDLGQRTKCALRILVVNADVFSGENRDKSAFYECRTGRLLNVAL